MSGLCPELQLGKVQQEKEALRSELSARIDQADESLQDVRELCIASQDVGLRAKLQDEVASAKRTADAAFSRADKINRTIAEVGTVLRQKRRVRLAEQKDQRRQDHHWAEQPGRIIILDQQAGRCGLQPGRAATPNPLLRPSALQPLRLHLRCGACWG